MSLQAGLSVLASRFLDTIFPPSCAACGQDGVWFCADCLALIEVAKRDPCKACGSLKNDHDCVAAYAASGGTPPTAVAHYPLNGLCAVGYYHDPRLRKLLHGLKYQYATCLLPTVREILRRYKDLRSQPWPWVGESALALQAVIGSPKRIRTRGFDQAEKIRDLVQRELLPWAQAVSLLERGSSVEAQADLKPGPLRQANVKNVFKIVNCRGEGLSPALPEAVVLVDDVFTTGSTMFEAARTLKSSGVKRVYGLVLAIGA